MLLVIAHSIILYKQMHLFQKILAKSLFKIALESFCLMALDQSIDSILNFE